MNTLLAKIIMKIKYSDMKNLTLKDWMWVLMTFVLSAIIGPFGLLPVFIKENTRHNRGEVDTFMTDRFATSVFAMILGICVLVAVATSVVI